MFVQTVNLPLRRLWEGRKRRWDACDDGVEERDDDEEYLQDYGEEEAEAEVVIAALLSNIVSLSS